MSIEVTTQGSNEDRNPLGEVELQQLQSCLRGMRFGSITLIIQDGYIVQIDRTEKRRLRRSVQNKSHSD